LESDDNLLHPQESEQYKSLRPEINHAIGRTIQPE
jgi:hypothetical protein